MPQATLRTSRLELVPLSEDHLPLLVDLNSDPLVHRFLYCRSATGVRDMRPIPGHEQGEVEYDITRDRWLTELRDR